MRLLFVCIFTAFAFSTASAQGPKAASSADILQQLKKLKVYGSVLYIAAHPDDENTRLLSYLANEKLYRTGYLSLTRGDGGQNLIGDEQGIDLGLIRTQELLAARRVDGAEQFFSRAYDFGFSKNPEEALRIWGHDKILSDVVWVIRTFRPDVIITRFPTTGEGGHGHHTASAILAGEAFDAAADPARFPEQLTKGVTTWQAKRLLWNTFNFGSTNTTKEDQLKIDVGGFNPVLGKSYGEMAAESRSNHKSQGFGVPAQRGSAFDYFAAIKGDKPVNDLMEGIDAGISRMNGVQAEQARILEDKIIKDFSPEQPALSVPSLTTLYTLLESGSDPYWKEQKLKEINTLIQNAGGLFLEATSAVPYVALGDSLKFNVTVNNRSGLDIRSVDVHLGDAYYTVNKPAKNVTESYPLAVYIPSASPLVTQPYWLQYPMDNGSFHVTDQNLIGWAENPPQPVTFRVDIAGKTFVFSRPLRYKFTDPVKGEIYQPLYIVPAKTVVVDPPLLVNNIHDTRPQYINIRSRYFSKDKQGCDSCMEDIKVPVDIREIEKLKNTLVAAPIIDIKTGEKLFTATEINYDHIPSIKYFTEAKKKIVYVDLRTGGKNIGYISGAGDKVPDALRQMGYTVTLLKEADIVSGGLGKYDAIITGVRAYNIYSWLSNAYPVLMQYVKDGGVMLVQYNTNNSIGPVKAKISPYPFAISRNRITDETAAVNFLMPTHPVLNYPNKITAKDFEGWIQERSIYNAENADSHYQRILSMKDPGENEQDGSLIVADYGKGRFVYTGLVFFRELPAGVPGAYRLFANLIAHKK
jgi:LmbE family N-acetylglucosaminyl deacetylase